ncbi:Cytochrome P450 monooxygenase 75 [Psilocybe cubensis]|uniref:Cytochrome P450 monooxygenase 75 n=1 Tax=Psilocybe cubensis TaxID=181762 RepID=A0ACB8H672_PSICU|nr:Cytochrome P450 monooxygenase 75 [Psilocybe cubensis]KAH9483187.1 Cytochrome P450 monooxygenase 75 [Psilocybe cubensis]
MGLSPGLAYLLRTLPYFAVPSAVTYATLKVLLRQTDTALPTPVIVFLSLLARPVLFFYNLYYSEWADNKAAAVHGAIIVPKVQEPLLSVVSKFAESFQGGYPGVFNSDGDMWKFHRAMSRPFFSRERISDFHIYDRNATISLQMAKKRLAEGYSIDFQDLIARFTLDSAAEFLFGGSVESLSAGMPYPGQESSKENSSLHDHPASIFADSFMEGLHHTVMRIRMGDAWPLDELMSDRVLPFRKAMDVFIDPLMKKALDKREQQLLNDKSPDEEEEETFISHLVTEPYYSSLATTGANTLSSILDPKVIKDELINLLLAGRDTTMCLLSFAVYMLAEHPDIETRLRNEILEKVGANETPTYDQMREMKYMRAFLNEVLRLYPPVPADSRISTKATVLPSKKAGGKPIYVPANTTVLYSVTNIHRREDLWGPDALKFDPDRFIDERLKKYFTPNPFIFCPFNAGPRICIGQQFAYHEATFYLVRLLQQFTEFSLDQSANTPPPAEWKFGDNLKGTEKIFPMAHVTMYIKLLSSEVSL